MVGEARTAEVPECALVIARDTDVTSKPLTQREVGSNPAPKSIEVAKNAAIAMATAVARTVVAKEARVAGAIKASTKTTPHTETRLVGTNDATVVARPAGTTPSLDAAAVPRALTKARTARWAAEVGIASVATLAIGGAAATSLVDPTAPVDGPSTSVIERTERELWSRVRQVVEWIDELSVNPPSRPQEDQLLESMRTQLRQLCLRGRELHALLVVGKRCGLLDFQENPTHHEWRYLVRIGIRASLHRMERQPRREPRKILRGVVTDCEGLAFRDQEVKIITFGCLQMAPESLPVIFSRRRSHPRNNDSDSSCDGLSPKRVARQPPTCANKDVTSAPVVAKEV